MTHVALHKYITCGDSVLGFFTRTHELNRKGTRHIYSGYVFQVGYVHAHYPYVDTQSMC